MNVSTPEELATRKNATGAHFFVASIEILAPAEHSCIGEVDILRASYIMKIPYAEDYNLS